MLDFLEIPHFDREGAADGIAVVRPRGDSLLLEPRRMADAMVPNVVGMGLRDAVYVLENRGLKVQIDGAGKVAMQSIKPGTRVKGQEILLTLR